MYTTGHSGASRTIAVADVVRRDIPEIKTQTTATCLVSIVLFTVAHQIADSGFRRNGKSLRSVSVLDYIYVLRNS